MNPAVKKYLDKKLNKKRERINALNLQGCTFQNLGLESEASRYYGFPDNTAMIDPDQSVLNVAEQNLPADCRSAKVFSNMAADRYQSLLALGTNDGKIKLFNLKGYEQEIDRAHRCAVKHLAFVPNAG